MMAGMEHFQNSTVPVRRYLWTSVANPYRYHFEKDPKSEKFRYGSGSRPNFDTDPGKNGTNPDQDKKVISTMSLKKRSFHMLCVFIVIPVLLNHFVSLLNT